MQDLYQVLSTPTVEQLTLHSIDYFNDLVKEYPSDYKKIITYINECFNYHSPFLVDEKDWGVFLRERFRANEIPEDLRPSIVDYESEKIVLAMLEFLAHQKESSWTTLVSKRNLRLNMLAVMQGGADTAEKQKANELLSKLDLEINAIYEQMKRDQKRFGNYTGIDRLKEAKNKHLINIANFIE